MTTSRKPVIVLVFSPDADTDPARAKTINQTAGIVVGEISNAGPKLMRFHPAAFCCLAECDPADALRELANELPSDVSFAVLPLGKGGSAVGMSTIEAWLRGRNL